MPTKKKSLFGWHCSFLYFLRRKKNTLEDKRENALFCFVFIIANICFYFLLNMLFVCKLHVLLVNFSIFKSLKQR